MNVAAALLHVLMVGFATGIAISAVVYWMADVRPRTEADIQRIACERAICPTPGGG